MKKRGVLYIAFGDRYRAEVKRSLASLWRVSPGMPVAVITDSEWEDSPRPDQFVLRPKVTTVLCKPTYMGESPFEETLFLDTDTAVARDPALIFNLLQYYDIGVHFNGPQLNDDGIELHAQCNSGVILFRRCEGLNELFEEWKRRYLVAREAAGYDGVGHGPVEQRHLAVAIARSRLRPVHLPTYMNFWVHENWVLDSPPVIIHGHLPDLEGISGQLGVGTTWRAGIDWRRRTWISNMRGLMPRGVRRSDPLLGIAIVARRFVNDWRRRLHSLRIARRGPVPPA